MSDPNLYICEMCHKPASRRKPCATIHELDGLCLGCWRELHERRDDEIPEVSSPSSIADGSIWQSKEQRDLKALRSSLDAANRALAEARKEAGDNLESYQSALRQIELLDDRLNRARPTPLISPDV